MAWNTCGMLEKHKETTPLKLRKAKEEAASSSYLKERTKRCL
ncbi:uncharacterized protein RAG0_00864 [Rhynchosporium agropyri]|uniref:Uncharacterized protein n=3 Tax=Rhynchosporium TaxID=38037 RepID=A0A1E1MQ30_RHYSE|nr:uncharacterized protein RAG0_00864 [Rhynchosporium agropyri]CZT08161.1 uncharacterized protein RCO7_14964 [Rhynchosporium commune]CZT51200.1 uncharacterized protein RSE6_12317 [Rhynchosporium secalis]